MRRSARIFSIIQKQIPGSVLYGDFLAVGNTDMFLRGFRLFTTGRKNHNDLHRGVTPLWRPHEQPSVSFGGHCGSLIGHPQTYWTITDPKNDRRSAEVLPGQIMPFASEPESIQTVALFMEYFDFMRDHDESWFTSFRPVVARIRQQLDSDPAGLDTLIRHWRNENVVRLGLRVPC